MATMAASQIVANSSSRDDNMKTIKGKPMDTRTELLGEGNCTYCWGLSIDGCRLGSSSLPLRSGKGSLNGVEAKLEPTNLTPSRNTGREPHPDHRWACGPPNDRGENPPVLQGVHSRAGGTGGPPNL
jgi:hypothetical protein